MDATHTNHHIHHESQPQVTQKERVDLDANLPDLSRRVIFAITFGFLGINMGFHIAKFTNEPDFPNNRG